MCSLITSRVDGTLYQQLVHGGVWDQSVPLMRRKHSYTQILIDNGTQTISRSMYYKIFVLKSHTCGWNPITCWNLLYYPWGLYGCAYNMLENWCNLVDIRQSAGGGHYGMQCLTTAWGSTDRVSVALLLYLPDWICYDSEAQWYVDWCSVHRQSTMIQPATRKWTSALLAPLVLFILLLNNYCVNHPCDQMLILSW